MTEETLTNHDLEILFPHQELDIAGEKILVREFSFIQGLKAETLARVMLADLGQLLAEQGEAIALDDLSDLFARHAETYVQLIALAVERSPDWVGDLSDDEGQLLGWTFWAVNKGFFTRRLAMRRLASRPLAVEQPQRDSVTSSPS